MGKKRAECFDCQRQYGDKYGFPDLIIPNSVWREISPTGDLGGLLCPSCIIKRLSDKKLHCRGSFMSGPIESITYTEMHNLRWIENFREQHERENVSERLSDVEHRLNNI